MAVVFRRQVERLLRFDRRLFFDGLCLLDEIIGPLISLFVTRGFGRRLGEFHQIGFTQQGREVHRALAGQIERAHRVDDLVGGHLHRADAVAPRQIAAQDIGQPRIVGFVLVVLPQLLVVESFERTDGLDVGRCGRRRFKEVAQMLAALGQMVAQREECRYEIQQQEQPPEEVTCDLLGAQRKRPLRFEVVDRLLGGIDLKRSSSRSESGV